MTRSTVSNPVEIKSWVFVNPRPMLAWKLKVKSYNDFCYSLSLWQTENSMGRIWCEPWKPCYKPILTIFWMLHNGNVSHWSNIGLYIMSRIEFEEVRRAVLWQKWYDNFEQDNVLALHRLHSVMICRIDLIGIKWI